MTYTDVLSAKYSSKIIIRPTLGQKVFLVILLLLAFYAIMPVFNSNLWKPAREHIIEVQAQQMVTSSSDSSSSSKIIEIVSTVPEKKTVFFDRVWVTNSNKVQLIGMTQQYINKYFRDSPVAAETLVNIAHIEEFPLDFLLVSGHYESHMCTKGRGADSNNCYNIDNTDAGDNKPTVCDQYTACLINVEKGIKKFIDLIKNCYINDNQHLSLQTFIDNDFRIQKVVPPYCGVKVGSRYMTDTRSRSKYIYLIHNSINPIFQAYQREV